MMATYPMAAAAAAAVAGNTCLPSGSFCGIPWICPGQPNPERLTQTSMTRRDGRLDEIVPGTSHQMLALHNSAVGPSPYFSLDSPSLMYSYYLGFGGADVRRKNATRESTSTLKAWLYEHRKNPYPTKGEKIMLAIITKMTLTQVSTWFANARRRLKKENKGEWGLKETNDPDEDDFEDDVTQCTGGTRGMTSASDTSSTRGSPDLPLAPFSPSAKRFPTPQRRLSADDDSQNSTVRLKVTNDDVITSGENEDHRRGFGSDVTSSLLSDASRSLVLNGSNPLPAPPTSASPETIKDRLISVSADVKPKESKMAPAVSPSSTTAAASGPAKRKLWSIDDIVSTAPPTERTPYESPNPSAGVIRPVSARLRGCDSTLDRSVPYKFSPYFVNGQRGFGGNAVTSFTAGSALFPWVMTSTVARFDGDVERRPGADAPICDATTNQTMAFNRPPSLSHTGFTSRKSPGASD